MATRTIVLSAPVDLVATLGGLRRGRHDPTMRLTASEVLRAVRTPDGPATVHLQVDGARARAETWGAGAAWALDRVDDLLGAADDPEAFRPRHALVRELHRRNPFLRICRTGLVLDALLPAILEQRVTGFEARRSFRQIVRRWGEPAPGPGELRLQPDPAVLAGLGYYELHPLGVERTRADAIKRACARASRLESLAELSPVEATARLRAVPGIGLWTAAEVAVRAFGDADAVSVGDYHLKHIVCFALAGERRGTDERMLELLAPFTGHRGRVCRLLEHAGFGPPRRAPRQRVEPMARR